VDQEMPHPHNDVPHHLMVLKTRASFIWEEHEDDTLFSFDHICYFRKVKATLCNSFSLFLAKNTKIYVLIKVHLLRSSNKVFSW